MKLGILGCGMIVKTALQTLQGMIDVSCDAIWSREEDKVQMEILKKQYNIKHSYTSIDEFLMDERFDVVYVGLINSVHYEYTKKALLAGKNVICEKPFTATYNQGKELLDIAKERHLFLFEAIMLRYLDNFDALKNNINMLGDIKIVQCNYSQYSSRFPKYLEGIVLPAFNPQLCGGSLYDINVYCVQFVVGLFGKPVDVHYYANKGFNGIDTSGILILDYGNFKAVCIGAKDSDSPSRCMIQGTKGTIDMDSMPGIVKNIKLLKKGEQARILDVKEVTIPMENEFNKIDEIINKKDYNLTYQYMETTLDVMKVLEDARKDAKIKFFEEE